MKSSKNLSRKFRNAAAFESKSRLFSEDELRTLLENAPVSYPPVREASYSPSRRTIMIGSTLLAGATAAVVWFSMMQDEVVDPATASIESSPHTEVNRTPLTMNTPSPSTTAREDQADVYTAQPAATSHLNSANNIATAEDQGLIQNPPSTIPGLRAVELSSDELLKLGVKPSGEGYELLAELGYSESDPITLTAFASNSGLHRTRISLNQLKLAESVRSLGYESANASLIFRVSADSFDLRSALLEATSVSRPQLYPLVVSHQSVDAYGSASSQVLLFGNSQANASAHEGYSDECTALFNLHHAEHQPQSPDAFRFPLMSKLIPVRIVQGDPRRHGSELILWYYPSQSFIDALPQRYADLIQRELRKINEIEQAPTQHERELLQKRYRGDYTYTDLHRSRSGALEILSISPNPAFDHSVVRIRCSEQRELRVVIYDMSGAQVAVVAALSAGNASDAEAQLNLSQLSSGAYLISVISDQNEQVIQRFVIQK